MSDTGQGGGWWQASDGKWYPPHLKPEPVLPLPPQAEVPSDPEAAPIKVPSAVAASEPIATLSNAQAHTPTLSSTPLRRWNRSKALWAGAAVALVAAAVIAAVALVPSHKGVSTAQNGANHNSTPNQTRWSNGHQIDTSGTGLNSISCPTTDFCVAVNGGGSVLAVNGGGAVSSQQIDYNTNVNGQVGLYSVSCATSTFCVAVDGAGNEFTYSGGIWSNGQQIDNSGSLLASVSCPTASFCVAVDNAGTEFTYSQGAWASGQRVDSSHSGLNSVSCPTTTFCVALGNESEFTYSSGSWSNGTQIDSETNGFAKSAILASVSCPTASFCVAVDNGGYDFTYSGGEWSDSQQIGSDIVNGNNRTVLTSVSCPTTSVCTAVDGGGSGYAYTATAGDTHTSTAPAPLTPPTTTTSVPQSTTTTTAPTGSPGYLPAPAALQRAVLAALNGAYPANEVLVTYRPDPSDPAWVNFGINPAPGFENDVQGAGGIAYNSGNMWTIASGPGTAFIGCPPTQIPIPESVLQAFGIGSCPSS